MWVDEMVFGLTFLAALGCGLVGGIFFAFSNFVMRSLGPIPAERGVSAMQSINVVVLNPVFLTIIVGTAAACLLLATWSLLSWQNPNAVFRLAGSALYLVGNLWVTRARNIPLNDALARIDVTAAGAADAWNSYVRDWTRWNHVRTITALGAAASLTVGLTRS
jgi:uncharacterized membrane protein